VETACEGAHVDQSNTQVDFVSSARRGPIYSTHGRFDEALLDILATSTGSKPSASCGSCWLTRSS